MFYDPSTEDGVKPNTDLSKVTVIKEDFHIKPSTRLYFFSFLLISITIVGQLLTYSNNTIHNAAAVQSRYIPDSTDPVPTRIHSPVRKEVIGFLPYWSVASRAVIFPDKVTQLIYFGLGVDGKGNLKIQNEDKEDTIDWIYLNSNYFREMRTLAANHDAKILIAIRSFDNKNIEELIGSSSNTDNFLKELGEIIEKYQFDGVNIDFEYFTSTSSQTTHNFNVFLKKLDNYLFSMNPRLIISFDVNASVVMVDKAYDMVKIGEHVDQVILMGYDFHHTNSTNAGPVAPLFSDPRSYSIDRSISSLIGRVNREKIILGIPFYGYEWQTEDETFKSKTIANTGAVATIRRINDLLEQRPEIRVNWDEESLTPWLTYRQSGALKQIYFENINSVREKLHYVNESKIGGIAIWALGYEGNNPELWTVIDETLNSN